MTHDRDDVLDELRAALDLTPSPQFQPRVRAAVETKAVRWPGQRWVFATAGVALTLMAAMTVWPRLSSSDDVPHDATTAVASPMATGREAASLPVIKTESVPERSRAPRAHGVGSVTSRRVVVQEVLVPPGQLQLLLAYAHAPRAAAGTDPDHVTAPVIEVVVPETLEVVEAPVVDVLKG